MLFRAAKVCSLINIIVEVDKYKCWDHNKPEFYMRHQGSTLMSVGGERKLAWPWAIHREGGPRKPYMKIMRGQEEPGSIMRVTGSYNVSKSGQAKCQPTSQRLKKVQPKPNTEQIMRGFKPVIEPQRLRYA